MLDYIISHAPNPSIDPSKPSIIPHGYGMVVSISHDFFGSLIGQTSQTSQMTILSSPPPTMPTSQNFMIPTQNFNVHWIHSSNMKDAQQPRRKERNKKNNSNSEKGNTPNTNVTVGSTKEKKKLKFPCNICNKDHLTHQFPQMDEIHIYLSQQGAPWKPIILTNPFPPQQQKMVVTNPPLPQGGTHGNPP
jgi:ribosomal protein L44E